MCDGRLGGTEGLLASTMYGKDTRLEGNGLNHITPCDRLCLVIVDCDSDRQHSSLADAHDHKINLVRGMSGGGSDTSLSNLECHQDPQGVRYCTRCNDSYPATNSPARPMY